MILDSVFSDFKKAIESIVIKYDTKAKELDTLEIRKEADNYLLAVNKEDSFLTYPVFTEEALRMAGINDTVLINQYIKDKSLIPPSMQERVIVAQRSIIVRDYVEKNNYYRMLNGQPDLEDTEFVFISESEALELELDHTKPVHTFSEDALIKIEKSGTLDRLKAKNPTKLYLNHLRLTKISISKARRAKNFTLLYVTNDMSEYFVDEFFNTYEQAREYFLTVIYNKDYGSRFDLYDNFIAMMIMVMTTQRLFTNTFKYAIERDFYDASSIQLMFNAYNVPYLEKLPLEHQRTLARNLNNLLHYKSTDKVLFDICSLLGYERINIFKYYLIKEHKLDDMERPVFAYVEKMNESTGEMETVEDTDAMYSLYFQTVELRERNIALSLSNTSNKLDYNQVIVEDPFWQDDEELREKLYASEFNYVESKYLGMNIMYKLTEMLFEIIYVFRMIADKKSETEKLTMSIPRIFPQRQISFFKILVLLSALISKKNNMAGNIISTPTKTLTIMGFNFSQDFTAIREEIRQNPNLYDQKILQYIQNMDIYSVQDINNLYINIKNFEKFLVEAMAKTQSLKQYSAYKKLYDTILTTDNVTTMFTKSDGEVASTFLDYLDDQDLVLAEFVRNVEQEAITEHVDHILSRLNASLKDLQHLYIFNDSNNVVMSAIITLIKFFKSYTTNLSSFNVLYLMDSRYHNMIKTISDIHLLESKLPLYTRNLQNSYEDYMKYNARITKKDYTKYIHQIEELIVKLESKNVIQLKEVVKQVDSNYYFTSNDIKSLKELVDMNVNDRYAYLQTLRYSLVDLQHNIDTSDSYILENTMTVETIKELQLTESLIEAKIYKSMLAISMLIELDDSMVVTSNFDISKENYGKTTNYHTSGYKVEREKEFNDDVLVYPIAETIGIEQDLKDKSVLSDSIFLEWEK